MKRQVSKPKSPAISSGDVALLTNFHGSMNHFSDVIHENNDTQPQSIVKDAMLKLMGAYEMEDKFSGLQKAKLLSLFQQNINAATIYVNTTDSMVRRLWAMNELGLEGGLENMEE
jgi:hypothetical protein